MLKKYFLLFIVLCFCRHDLQNIINAKEEEKSTVEESHKQLLDELSKINEEKTEKENFLNEEAK